jgi:hypothetical protein
MQGNVFQDLTKTVINVIIFKLDCNNQIMEENHINRLLNVRGNSLCSQIHRICVGAGGMCIFNTPDFIKHGNL